MSIVLLLDIVWILVCTFGTWWGRGSIPATYAWGAPILWLLMVILGLILINLLVPGGSRAYY